MKKYKVIVLVFLAANLLLSCGKPTEPESLYLDATTGDYQIISIVETHGYAQDAAFQDDLLYVAQGEGGLMIIDVSDPEKPDILSSVNTNVRGYFTKIIKKDDAVYLAAGSFGVSVVDVSDPLLPVGTQSNLPMKPARDFHIVNDYLFTSVSEQGVAIADVSLAMYPEGRGSFNTTGYARGITATADSAMMMVTCGEVGLSIFDISDFQQGYGEYPELAICETPGYAESILLLEDKSLACIACGTAGLQIIDYSDINNVRIVGSYDGSGYAKDLVYKNNTVYMTAETGGLQIIDIEDPANPILIGTIDLEYALGIVINGNNLYVSGEEEGVIVLSIP